MHSRSQQDAGPSPGTPGARMPRLIKRLRPPRPRVRRPITVVTAGLIATSLLAVPDPAGAAHYEVAWDENVSPADNAAVAGEVTLKLAITSLLATTHGKVEEWRLELWRGTTPLGALCADDYGSTGDDEVPVELEWDTRYLPGPSEPSLACDTATPSLPGTPDAYTRNGAHTLKVWVKTNDGSLAGALSEARAHEHVFDRTIKVDNEPSMPTGVTASFNATTQRMIVSWNANQEPDVSGYVVDQCVLASAQTCSSSDWARVANPSGLNTVSVSLAVTDPGVYRYRVAAKRPRAESGEFLSSAAQSGSVALEEGEFDPSPTTTVGGDGTGGGGGGSTDGPAGTESGDDGSGTTGPGDEGSGSTGSRRGRGGESDRGLPPRLVDRTEVDAGYEEALPYGAKPLDETGGALEIAARGVGLASIPIAGGLLLFVFAMQMRYLSRRAGTPALADTGAAPPTGGDPVEEAPTPLLHLGAGGSFISNWRRLLDQ